MCTAIHLRDEGLLGRTLDFEAGFGESVVFTPREFMRMGEARNRYSVLGIGVLKDTSTLYFDGVNEWGLTGAALHFPGYAVYHCERDKKADVPSGLLLSFILGFCKDIGEAKDALSNISITNEKVLGMSPSPLHWIFADKNGAITVESTKEGLRVMDNPYGVLTNSPDFNYHVTRLADYMTLRADCPENRLTKAPLTQYSRGMGAIGLPGDFSSSSRFVRGVFVKENIRDFGGEDSGISRMMHILSSVSVPCGCVVTKEGGAVATLYTCTMDGENLTYYYNSYGNGQLRAVKLYPEDTDMRVYPVYEKENICQLN